jgi:endonuclease YncB( thermonuclease family)
VACIEVDRDQYKRSVAVCTVAGIDLAEWLVKNGLAVDWPQYSKGAYSVAQTGGEACQSRHRDGSFIEPWRYRACRRTGGSAVSCSDQVNDSAF